MVSRRTQSMTPAGEPLFIETAAGLIKIEWDRSRTPRRKTLLVTLPSCYVVHRSEERALKELRFLRMDGERLVPDYSILAPVVSDSGEIMAIERPAALKLGLGKQPVMAGVNGHA